MNLEILAMAMQAAAEITENMDTDIAVEKGEKIMDVIEGLDAGTAMVLLTSALGTVLATADEEMDTLNGVLVGILTKRAMDVARAVPAKKDFN